jgi:glycosyltransferase involved in cell wall biosynthesis
MSNPLVSVVVAVMNGERFLEPAVQSILAQDYRPIEIIVVDGHSTDRTADVAKSHDLVRYVLQEGRGIADAYNLGIALAQGELIAFLSHDDLWTPDKLSVQVAYMQQHPEIGYTVARVKFFLEPGCDVPPGFRPELLVGDHVGRVMENVVARRWVFDAVGGFNTSLRISEDVDWFLRASDMGVLVAVFPKVLLHKRVHDANTSLFEPSRSLDLLAAVKASVRRKRGVGGNHRSKRGAHG